MIADNDFLQKGLKSLVRNNAAGEYYLTDLVEFAYLLNNNTEKNNNEVSIIPKNYVGELKKLILPIDKKLTIYGSPCSVFS